MNSEKPLVSIDAWVGRIRPHLNAAAESIIAAGKELSIPEQRPDEGSADLYCKIRDLGMEAKTIAATIASEYDAPIDGVSGS